MKTVCVFLALIGLSFAAESVTQFINDNHVLNYALTLENFEANLYAQVSRFQDSDFNTAGYPPGTRAAISYIGGIEASHAVLLTATLAQRGWPSAPVCSNYNYSSIATVTQFVNTLALVEAVGTSAYDGAALAISDKTLLTIAAGIATVEARHTSLLNVVANATQIGAFTPFLDSTARSAGFNFTYVQSLIAPFFQGATCPPNTTFVKYLNGGKGASYTVNSANATSYQWTSANAARGQTVAFPFYATNSTVALNDLAVLNYALALENLEATFYANFSALYNATTIQAAGVSAANASLIAANIAVIAAHEASHVNFLTAAISGLNYPNAFPGTACSYNISILGLNSTSTFQQFLSVAATLENTGVTAYVGAISYLVNSDLTTTAATIATVEGEHAAYISNLLANLNNYGSNQINPNAVTAAAGQTDANPPTATNFDVAFGQRDFPTPPATIQNSIKLLLNCTAQQFGSPLPISAAQFLNFFNDQDVAFNTPFVVASSSSSSSSTGTSSTVSTPINTNTTPQGGNGVALVASVAVVLAAIMMV